MDREAWRVTVHGVAKNRAQLSNSHTHTHTHTHMQKTEPSQTVSSHGGHSRMGFSEEAGGRMGQKFLQRLFRYLEKGLRQDVNPGLSYSKVSVLLS